ncbi:hypothetical protein ACQPVP_07660 [Clostridium nigeriense]|uniref:hypothetical protein n=1 Tax=Clostridium nigeriense TaxID=1805470 RepID=UPI003D32EC7E
MCDIKGEEYIGDIKKSIEEKMKKLFEKAHKYTENLSNEDIVKLHENHVKDVFYPYIHNIPALKERIVEKAEEKVLEEVKYKFMENFHFHEKMLKCEKFREDRKTKYTEEEILENDRKISKYIQEIVISIIQECKGLNTEQIKEIHMFIFKVIFQSDIEHIPCFKNASETMNMDVINRIHNRKVTSSINKYI